MAYPENASFTVTQAMNAAKRSLESLRLTVTGEVSEFNDKPGYKAAYFTISDTGASMPCLMWRDQYLASGVLLRAGSLVEIDGYFSAYVPKGRMQFTVRSLRLAGEGDLRLKVAELARKLEAEGLMESFRKKPIPKFPQRIGVVTSPRGKAVHDVIRTLRRRFPLAEIMFAGVTVEGENAPEAIADGLKAVEASSPDVILLVRGGGSYEDLMPFNSEVVARAIAQSRVPVVTGIGHEPDTTISDMVSDLRASTPTAASEAVTPSREELDSRFLALQRQLGKALYARLVDAKHRVERLSDKPLFNDPFFFTGSLSQSLDLAEMRLGAALPKRIERDSAVVLRAEQRLDRIGATVLDRFKGEVGLMAAQIHSLSPLAILGRGYSVTYKEDAETVIKSINQVAPSDKIKIRVSDGMVDCTVAGTIKAKHEEHQ